MPDLPEGHSLNPFIFQVTLTSGHREVIKAYTQEPEEAARILLRVKINDLLKESSEQLDEWVKRA